MKGRKEDLLFIILLFDVDVVVVVPIVKINK